MARSTRRCEKGPIREITCRLKLCDIQSQLVSWNDTMDRIGKSNYVLAFGKNIEKKPYNSVM